MAGKVMFKKNIFICFIGIDGSGKTTLAKTLAESMNNNGNKSKYVYNRSMSIITKPITEIGKLLFLRRRNIFSNYKEYSDKKRALFKHRNFCEIHRNVLLFDYFIQTVIKIKIPLWIGKSVICDRYVYDTIITDFAAYTNYSIDEVKKILDIWLNLFPKPDLVFLIDVPEEIAFKRKNDTPSIEYLKERRYIYLDVGKEYRMIILDGSRDLIELNDFVNRTVKQYILEEM